jgi:hypothetical protein
MATDKSAPVPTDVPGPGLPVVDWTHGEAGATYDLPGRCLTCGHRFLVRRLRGIAPPLSVECPGACGTTQYGWRDRAALAAPAAPLDVERLARALALAEVNCWANPESGHKITDPDDGTAAHRRDAEAIAREYARQREGKP